MRRARRQAIAFAAVLLFVAGWAGASASAEPQAPDAKVITRTITGDVVSVTRSAISLEFARSASSAEEMLLPYDAKTAVRGPKTLSALAVGDRVRVDYLQTYKEVEGRRVILKTLATAVTLVKSTTGESTLRTEDAEGVLR